MKKQKNLEKEINNIIQYIEDCQTSHHANEPNAQGIKTLLQELLK